MARTRIRATQGRTISQIMDISIDALERMPKAELSETVSRLVSAANKRIKRAGNTQPGYSVAGQNREQLVQTYKKVSSFLVGGGTTNTSGLRPQRVGRKGGQTVKAILETEPEQWQKMTEPQMRKAVAKLASVANKRIDRLLKSGVPTFWETRLEKEGGRFTTKGKSLNELRAEYMRAKTFLESRWSTVTGAKQLDAKVTEGLEGVGVQHETTGEIRKIMWRVLEEVRHKYPDMKHNKEWKYRVMDLVDKIVEEKSKGTKEEDIFEAALAEILPKVDAQYKEVEAVKRARERSELQDMGGNW